MRHTQGPPIGCDSPSSVASGRNRENSVPLHVAHKHRSPQQSGRPVPVPNRGRINPVLMCVVHVFNNLILQPVFYVSSHALQPRHAIDYVNREIEPVDLI
jgi:hypothetical protein